jgi:fibronectin-binding autotransporter adhesin
MWGHVKVFFVGAFALLIAASVAEAGTTWDGGDGADFWNWNNNWNPDGSPSAGTTVDLTFGGTTRLTPNNNYTDWSDFRSIYFASGAGAFTISGNSIDFFDGKLENNDDSLQTISIANMSFNSGSQEVNPVSGNLTLGGGGNIFNNGQYMDVYGDNGNTLTLGMAMQGTGGISINQNSIVNVTVAQTYTGDTFINEGSLRIDQGGSLGGTIVRVGRTSGSDTAQLYISDADGGTSEDATIVIRAGSSGTLTVGGLNTSGDNTFSGGMSLDNNVTLSAAAGGRTIFSGAITDGAGVGTFGAAINAAGTVQLAGSSANSGVSSWTVQEGILQLNKTAGTDAINSGLTIENGGTVRLLAAGQINNSVDVALQSGGTFDLNSNNEQINSLALVSGSSLTLGTGDLTLGSQANATWAGTISGSAGSAITKIGNNTVSITGNNTFDGDIYIDGGVIGFNHANAISSAGIIHIGVSGGANNSSADISVNGVTIAADIVVESGTGTRTIDQAVGSGTVTFSGDVTLNKDLNVTAASGETLVLSGAISGGNKVIKAQDGTVTLSGTSTYTGNTEIDAGTLNVAGDLSGSSTIFLGNGGNSANATLALSGSGSSLGTLTVNTSAGAGTRNIDVTAGSHTIAGTTTVNRDTSISASGGSVTFGAIDLDQASDFDLNINAGAGSVTLGGTITADSGASVINKSGSGTLTISGNNSGSSYLLNIAAGTVALDHANAVGTAYSDKINFTGSGTLDVNANVAPAGLGIRVANGATGTLDVNSGNTFTVAGALANISGSGTFTKTGAGTLTISGNSTYTGTFNQNQGVTDVQNTLSASSGINVNGGTLNVDGTAGNVTMNGGTLTGSGGVGDLVVGSGGVLSPGNSPGTIFAGNTTWDNGGSYLWEINDVDAGAGTGWDLLDVTGTLTINAGFDIDVTSLTLGNVAGNVNDFDGTQDYIGVWLIATASGGILGSPLSPSINLGGFSNPYQTGAWYLSTIGNGLYINYDYDPLGPPIDGGGGGGSSVPEPNAMSLAMLAGLLLVSFRNRMKKARRAMVAA